MKTVPLQANHNLRLVGVGLGLLGYGRVSYGLVESDRVWQGLVGMVEAGRVGPGWCW